MLAQSLPTQSRSPERPIAGQDIRTPSAVYWAGVLLVAVWAAHWGAEQLAEPLKKLRRQWGISAAAGGALIGIASASPEIGINVASAARGVGDIGLGTALGSNIIAIPLVVAVAYVASRRRRLGGDESQGDPDEAERGDAHREHVATNLLRMDRAAVRVQALPYFGILALFAALTLPSAWRGLQPVDGWILLGAYTAFLAQAMFRGREEMEEVDWTKKEIALAVAGVGVLALGAFFTVRATENIVSGLGIEKVVGGLFITAPMAALPEIFAVWSVVRSGQVTSATTSVIGDHAVTMTVAFLPLALVTLPVENMPLFATVMGFVALMPAAYAAFVHWGGDEHGVGRWQVLTFGGLLTLYVGVMLFGVLRVTGG